MKVSKLVKLTSKATGSEEFFGSYSSIFRKYDKETIGAVIGTVWNTVRLTGGSFENNKVKIELVDVEEVTKVNITESGAVIEGDELIVNGNSEKHYKVVKSNGETVYIPYSSIVRRMIK